jgi:uncharacterized repeat protein (TIGR03803 family)
MNQLFTSSKFFIARQAKNICICAAILLIHQTIHAQNVLVGLSSNGGPNGKGTAFSLNTNGNNFSVIKGFEDWGSVPSGSLLKDVNGFFYGMTSTGGTYNAGSIFKMSPSGNITILKQFNLNVDGGYPDGELIKGNDDFFYGLTSSGGPNGYGAIFKISADGNYTLLKSFSINTDGGSPNGHLVLAKDGNFYGTAHRGGANGAGTIFKLTSAGVFSVIYNMNKATDGGDSYSSLTEGKDGDLYGATYAGGSNGYGTIFKITTAGVLTVLKNLNGTSDGGNTQSDLIQASDNNFYGTCYNGGSVGYGTIFKITTNGTYTVIKNLSYSSDGANPASSLMQNSDGNFYGITKIGGSNGAGTIYKLTQAGIYSVIHHLNAATDGNTSSSGLINGFDNDLYALCSFGGANNMGTVFKVSTTGSLMVLNNFNGAVFGNIPYSTFIKGKDSAYYATTSAGGAYNFGTIIKICGGTTTVLHSFDKTTEGGYPKGKLLLANDGNFYGMTSNGGAKNGGTIFKFTPSGNYSVLYTFNSTTDGGYPFGGLIQAADGFLYGMTTTGGTNVNGTIFKINLSGKDFSVLHHFLNATDGTSPTGDLLQANDGNFYGMTSTNAKIFKLTPGGVFTIIHSFISSTEGYIPMGSLIQGIDGNFYGTCSDGGPVSGGSVFQCTLTGTLKVINGFNNFSDGKYPKGTLLQGADGMLYGTTNIGGTYNAGTIFKVQPKQGSPLTILHTMNMDVDGGNASGGLIFAPVNNLIADAQSVTTKEDTKKKITLKGSGGLPLDYNIVAKPKHGTLTGTAPNLTYKPKVNFNGKDSFSFTVSVGCMTSKPAFVNIKVNAVADTPVLAPIGNQTVVKNATLTFTAAATDGDKGQQLIYSLIGAPGGTSINATTGVFTWTPTKTGSFIFKVRVTDNTGLYDEEQITVTVTNTLVAMNESKMSVNNKIEANIYPNPVQDKIHINTQQALSEATIRIIDLKGSVIISNTYQSKNNFEIDASHLTSGMYILQLQTANGFQSFKFIKN